MNNPPGSRLRSIQERVLDVVSFPPILIKGRGIFQYSFGIVPKRRPITTVGKLFCFRSIATRLVNRKLYGTVGKPIKVEQITDPTQDVIDQLHSASCKMFFHSLNYFHWIG